MALGTYESFLFLMGSVFVPLFGVFVADYFLLGRRGRFTNEMFDRRAGRTAGPGLNAPAIAAWIVGFLIYQWSVPTGPVVWQHAMKTLLHDWMALPFPLWNSVAGASIPSFGAALILYAALATMARARGRAAKLSR